MQQYKAKINFYILIQKDVHNIVLSEEMRRYVIFVKSCKYSHIIIFTNRYLYRKVYVDIFKTAPWLTWKGDMGPYKGFSLFRLYNFSDSKFL